MHCPAVGMDSICDPFCQEAAGEYSISEAYIGGNPAVSGQVAPTVYALVAAIDAKDSFTFQHSTNVSQYAVLLAQKLGLPGDDIQTVKVI